MQRSTLFLAVIATLALTTATLAQENRTTTINRVNDGAQCDAHNTSFGDEPTFRSEEQQTLPAGVTNLFVHGVHNGGVYVQGGPDGAVQLKICKLVAAEDEAAAQRRFAMIRPQVSGGDISAVGHDDGRR